MMLSGTVATLLTGKITRQVLMVLLIIEGIFLAESLTGLLEQVLRYGGASIDVIGVLLLTAPEIFDLALPLALLVGVYTALVSSREDSEFIVCSAAGISWNRIPAFVAVVGVAGFAASLLIAGYLNPLAAYGKRIMLFNLQAEQILEQMTDTRPRDALETYGGRTFVASRTGTGAASHAQLFIHHPPEETGWRVTQAQDWTVDGPDADGNFVIIFGKVLDYAFVTVPTGSVAGVGEKAGRERARSVPVGGAPAATPDITAIQADTVSLPISVDKIIKETDRVRQDKELSLSEVLGQVGVSQAPKASVQRRAGEILGRALLCPVACLLALAAVVFAQAGIARHAALPVAAVGVLAFDTISRAALGLAAQSGLGWLLLAALALALLCALPIVAVILNHGERIIRPVDSRA